MREIDLQNLIRLELGKNPDIRLWRNNVGQGWQGTMVSHKNGVVILENARPLHAGLFNGSSDLIGYKTRWIGLGIESRMVAQFASVEIKTDRGLTSPAQHIWIDTVLAHGGIAGVVRSPEEAVALFQ